MVVILIQWMHFLKKEKQKSTPPDPLLQDIQDIITQIHAVHSLFNATCDPNLVDGLIYQMNSLNSRYSYLIQEAKKKNLISAYQPKDWLEERVYGKLG